MGLSLYLCRHGDTPWSPERRLAGRTDLPLTPGGIENAKQLGERLRPVTFTRVFTSPLSRAKRTAEAAGYGAAAQEDARLLEMDFGKNEGRIQAEIRAEQPGWSYCINGNEGGERIEDMGARIDAWLADVRRLEGNVLVFAHSVLLRVLAARWLGQPAAFAANLMLAPATLSILAVDPTDDAPAIALWNDRSHVTHGSQLA